MKNLLENKLRFAAILALLVLLGGFAYSYFSRATRSTENAYINADVVEVASQVAGRVISVHVKDNQYVQTGRCAV